VTDGEEGDSQLEARPEEWRREGLEGHEEGRLQVTELSRQRLAECHPDIRRVIEAVDKVWPLNVSCGHRDKKVQDHAYMTGKSKLVWPMSNHNQLPSRAVDIQPTEVLPSGKATIDWNDTQRFCYLAGYVLATAHMLGVKMRWGGDWDMDTERKDNKFNDLPHFELV